MDSKTLVEQHTPLALSIGNDYFKSYPQIAQTELVSEAYVGLMKAGDSFDPSKGVTFGSFAKIVIKNHILDYISKQRTYFDRIKLKDDHQLDEENESLVLEELDEIDPLREAQRTEIKKLLLTQRMQLTLPQQEMIDLLSLGYNYTEIGEKMGISKQAAHKSVQKALESMRQGLEENDINNTALYAPTPRSSPSAGPGIINRYSQAVTKKDEDLTWRAYLGLLIIIIIILIVVFS